MLLFHVDPRSGVPVYRQIMEQVKFYRASGLLEPGEKLPSIRALAKALSVNPTTIVKAYNELQHEKVVELRQGKGVFLAPSLPGSEESLKEEALLPLVRDLAGRAARLGLTPAKVDALIRRNWPGPDQPAPAPSRGRKEKKK